MLTVRKWSFDQLVFLLFFCSWFFVICYVLTEFVMIGIILSKEKFLLIGKKTGKQEKLFFSFLWLIFISESFKNVA